MKTIFHNGSESLEINLIDDIDYSPDYCPATNAFHRLNGKYKLTILYLLLKGNKRNSELMKAIPGLSEKVLAQRLDELEADKIIHREVFPTVPPKVEYSLTPYGETLRPVFESLIIWGSSHEVINM
ncbi:MAG: helix-turn-helix domain-containing protein [Chitinophagales bacterium]